MTSRKDVKRMSNVKYSFSEDGAVGYLQTYLSIRISVFLI